MTTLWTDTEAQVLRGRTIAEAYVQSGEHAEEGWPVLHFTDGSRLVISGRDDVDLNLRKRDAVPSDG